ncbi:3-deoxy-7-phosphoheptulonate synthase [Humisphaera borealis]|uniref:3-deoxy-7-phosphoheptulonate synthase n=1 Tax=Humisphaera borealis TaxID=2807512 RepID=A0A7M2WVM4_9BACT|nr:3-deoxy-7-phosphoheptulonate synthase [Humisphaera borealis]QOV88891.1 3-deoxy-7-phosphoheptulonate synthase [Humisphaera borealis]
MIVVMKQGSTPQQVEHVVQLVREMGLKENVIVGEERTVVAVIGNDRFKDRTAMESVAGVEKVVPILAPYKMASREIKKERSVVQMGSDPLATVGGKKIGIIAGPCSVENKTQLLEIAHAVKEHGAVGLRGGAFKPRTNPYSFQGMGEKGLELLALARQETGLAVVTEVMAVDQVELVVKYADVLQVGARNMQNFNLLNAVGDQRKPVLLKRGLSATLEEFLLAAEYIMSRGNHQVMLCERGIRTYEEYVRNTLALAAVPALQRASHLPVVVDPSQGTGKNYLVDSMCRASVAAGADGLIIEVHNDPEHALTDGAQSITPEQFASMMKAIKRIAAAVDREV